MKELDAKPVPSLREVRNAIQERQIDRRPADFWGGDRSARSAGGMQRTTERLARKTLEFATEAVESLGAPILTREQKRQGQIADRERRIAAEDAERQRRSHDRDR